MKPRMILIGAGNVGGYISYNLDQFGDYQVLGFLDDDPAKAGRLAYGRPVLGAPDQIDRYLSEGRLSVVLCIASPADRLALSEKLSHYAEIDFPNLISPAAWVSRQVTLGKGVMVYPNVSINYETSIGDFAIINMNCAIGHNSVLGRCATLAPGVNLAGFTSIGMGAEMGIGSSTRQRVSVGDFARVGGQAMVIGDVPAHATAMGVPAKVAASDRPGR